MDLSKSIAVKKSSAPKEAPKGTGLDYLRNAGGLSTAADRLARRVLLLDGSGSMSGSLLGTPTGKEDLPDGAVQLLRSYVREFHAGSSLVSLDQLPDIMKTFLPTAGTMSDEDLAQSMVEHPQILAVLNMEPKSFDPETCRKDQLSIEFVRTMIEDRFNNNPADAMGVIEFTHSASPMGLPGNRQSMLDALNRGLSGGGTNIANAMEAGYSAIQGRPSIVGQNQVITVTDGQDSSFNMDGARNLYVRSRAFNVVFDFIYLVSWAGTSESAKALRWLAEKTGGKYVEVWTKEQYRTKFLEASKRVLMITDGRS